MLTLILTLALTLMPINTKYAIRIIVIIIINTMTLMITMILVRQGAPHKQIK